MQQMLLFGKGMLVSDLYIQVLIITAKHRGSRKRDFSSQLNNSDAPRWIEEQSQGGGIAPVEAVQFKNQQDPSTTLLSLMGEYFNLIDNFFEECTGFKAETSSAESLNEIIAKDREAFIRRSETIRRAYEKYIPEITKFYGTNHKLIYTSCQSLPGLKSVVGGSSRFPIAAFDGVRKFALYADTILIPDPVLPWLEVDRLEEKFRHVEVLAECFNLLKLKPLASADLPYPAIVTFPSWEKRMERSDQVTREGIMELVLNFFSGYLGKRFEDESELFPFIENNKDEFLRIVEREQLFIPPGDRVSTSAKEAVAYYREYLKEQRSPEYNAQMQRLPDELLLATGIMDRIGPQFHIRDNSNEFGAQPLFWLNVHFHYFQLCSKVSGHNLQEKNIINPGTLSVLQSLQNPSIAWLGNVPIKDLVDLRMENQNHEFRRKLKQYFDTLYTCNYDDLDKVAAEVGRAISVLLTEHDKAAKDLDEKFLKKHLGTLGLSVLTAGTALAAWLDPFAGAEGVIPLLAKLGMDLTDERKEGEKLSKSLVGILSEAQKSGQSGG